MINTIPAPVIGRRELAALEEGTLVLDLASAPGGVDFAAAKEYFIPTRLELGLPGKWFPVQAGRLLGETVREILEEHWEKGGNRQMSKPVLGVCITGSFCTFEAVVHTSWNSWPSIFPCCLSFPSMLPDWIPGSAKPKTIWNG